MGEFVASDPLQIDDLLSQEEREIRGAVREFVQGEVLANVGDWFEKGVFPREVMAGVARLGLLGMHLTGYGCLGSNAVSTAWPVWNLRPATAGFVPSSACRVR